MVFNEQPNRFIFSDSFFNNEKRIFKEKRSESRSAQESPEQLFRNACKKALADGKLTIDEKHELKDLAKSLGMSKEAMKQLFEDEKRIFLESRSKK